MTKENKLEDLRNRKKKLSQEQVAIKMGLYGKREGSARDAISKFENGTTQNWGFLHVIHYANAIEASLDEIATALYPDEPYCSSLLMEEERNCENVEEKQDKNNAETDITENAKKEIICEKTRRNLIIGPSGYKRHEAMMSEVENAIKKGENLFIISTDLDVEKILVISAKTGHEVCVFSNPCEYLQWEDCVTDPQSIAALSTSIVHQTKGQIDEPEEIIRILYDIMMQVLEKNNGKLSIAKVYDRILKETTKRNINSETKNKLALINILLIPYMYKTEQKVSLADIMEEKHVIIFDEKHYFGDIRAYSLILEQYMRRIYDTSWKKRILPHYCR